MKRINVNKDQLKSLRFGTTLNRDGRNSVNGYVFRDGNNVIYYDQNYPKRPSEIYADSEIFKNIVILLLHVKAHTHLRQDW